VTEPDDQGVIDRQIRVSGGAGRCGLHHIRGERQFVRGILRMSEHRFYVFNHCRDAGALGAYLGRRHAVDGHQRGIRRKGSTREQRDVILVQRRHFRR